MSLPFSINGAPNGTLEHLVSSLVFLEFKQYKNENILLIMASLLMDHPKKGSIKFFNCLLYLSYGIWG